MKKIIILFILLFCIGYSAVDTCTTCDNTDMQSIHDAASAGDTLFVPSGNYIFTTPSPGTPALDISNSNYHLMGEDSANTIILNNCDHNGTFGNFLIRITADTFYMSNIQVSDTFTSTGYTIYTIRTTAACEAAIIYNCHFESAIFRNGYCPTTTTYGCFSNNWVRNLRIEIITAGDSGNTNWRLPAGFGTDRFLFVEDNIFDMNVFANSIDNAAVAARVVFRYNTCINTYCEGHPTYNVIGTAAQGGSRAYEVYQNSFTYDGSVGTGDKGFSIRGGTALCYNNTCVNTGGGPLTGIAKIYYDRAYDDHAGSGKCDSCESWDGNIDIGYPCVGQPGRGQDTATVFTSLNGGNQIIEMLHFWNNTYNGAASYPTIGSGSGDVTTCDPGGNNYNDYYIQYGREYDTLVYAYTPYEYPHPLNPDYSGGGPVSNNISRGKILR